ncbi:uncharacterized protein LOC131843805 [Achroia grisella]|uniref:uncharacterized protein LOC131843805 n=1 Tax=Achroia grisella TaxID=688607 RepID=UPI0027D2B3CB|nr:uncharacterized protein LOC131843805 [Achroia grisella]
MYCYRQDMTSESMLSVIEIKKIYVKPGAAYRNISSVHYHDYYNYNVSCNSSTHWLHINDKNEILQVSKMPENKTDVQFTLHLNKTHYNSKLYCIQFKCSSPQQIMVQSCIRNVTAVTNFKEDSATHSGQPIIVMHAERDSQTGINLYRKVILM